MWAQPSESKRSAAVIAAKRVHEGRWADVKQCRFGHYFWSSQPHVHRHNHKYLLPIMAPELRGKSFISKLWRGLIFILWVLYITEQCELLVDWRVEIFTLKKCDSQACGDSHVRAGNQFWHVKCTFSAREKMTDMYVRLEHVLLQFSTATH